VSVQVDQLIRASPLFRRLPEEDRKRLAAVSQVRSFAKGDFLFSEGDPSDFLYIVADGRVKIVKLLPTGKEVIIEIFGPGDPVGAVAALESRPYPASAVAMAPSLAIVVQRGAFFSLLETSPGLVRGLLVGLSFRLVELTRRISEVAGSKVETRFAHLFLKLGERMGQKRPDGLFIPMPLSRQDLADLTGTSIETAIRLMSRWGKDGVVLTEKDGFLVADWAGLEALVLE
jgi:CRP-like cAMP-binding protein